MAPKKVSKEINMSDSLNSSLRRSTRYAKNKKETDNEESLNQDSVMNESQTTQTNESVQQIILSPGPIKTKPLVTPKENSSQNDVYSTIHVFLWILMNLLHGIFAFLLYLDLQILGRGGHRNGKFIIGLGSVLLIFVASMWIHAPSPVITTISPLPFDSSEILKTLDFEISKKMEFEISKIKKEIYSEAKQYVDSSLSSIQNNDLNQLQKEIEKFEEKISISHESLSNEIKKSFNEISDLNGKIGEIPEKLTEISEKFENRIYSESDSLRKEMKIIPISGTNQDPNLIEKLKNIENLLPFSFENGPNYALGSAGAKVVWASNLNLFSKFSSLVGLSHAPSVILHNEMLSAGRCYSFNEGKGQILVKLKSPVIPRVFAIEHLPVQLAFDVHSAPRDYEIYGLQTTQDPNPVLLCKGQYLIEPVPQPSRQYCNVSSEISSSFAYVRLDILSNHWDSYTCLYRFRVYGKSEN